MGKNSTQDLLILHAYGETTLEQREFLAILLATDENLQEELMEIIQTNRELTAQLKSPSQTSVRIIMGHSYKTEHLQEI